MRRFLTGLGALVLLAVLLIAGLYLRILMLPGARPDAVPPYEIALDREGAIDRLAAALRHETVSFGTGGEEDRTAFAEFQDFLRASFPLTFDAAEITPIGRDALLLHFPGTDSTLLPYLLLAHQDVVPAGDASAWRYPPFSGTLADGYVWGRGALDDKGALMATLEAIETLRAEGHAMRRGFYVAFGADEELGGLEGAARIAGHFAQQDVRLAFVLDEGLAVLEGIAPGVDAPVAMIGIAEKGSLSLRIRAEAPGGHSSMPPAVSAPGRLARAIVRLETHQMPASLDGVAGRMLTRLAPHMDFPLNLLAGNLWLTGPLVRNRLADVPSSNALIRTTTAVTMLRGGIKSNVLAPDAEATINFRLRPGDTAREVLDHVRETVDDLGIDVIGDPEEGREASAVSPDDGPAFDLIAQSIAAVFPRALIAPGLVVAGTDSRHFEKVADAVYRFSPYRLTPGDLPRLHGVDERIGTGDYLDMIRFYARLITLADGAEKS
ncbi:MAG: M20 family peptidase [Rhodothalassiaceae bacterium]